MRSGGFTIWPGSPQLLYPTSEQAHNWVRDTTLWRRFSSLLPLFLDEKRMKRSSFAKTGSGQNRSKTDRPRSFSQVATPASRAAMDHIRSNIVPFEFVGGPGKNEKMLFLYASLFSFLIVEKRS